MPISGDLLFGAVITYLLWACLCVGVFHVLPARRRSEPVAYYAAIGLPMFDCVVGLLARETPYRRYNFVALAITFGFVKLWRSRVKDDQTTDGIMPKV